MRDGHCDSHVNRVCASPDGCKQRLWCSWHGLLEAPFVSCHASVCRSCVRPPRRATQSNARERHAVLLYVLRKAVSKSTSPEQEDSLTAGLQTACAMADDYPAWFPGCTSTRRVCSVSPAALFETAPGDASEVATAPLFNAVKSGDTPLTSNLLSAGFFIDCTDRVRSCGI
jgi:hypothetical protein